MITGCVPPYGLGSASTRVQRDELAVEVERAVAFPDHAHDAQPLRAVGVARFVIALRDAEHLELVFVPAAHDVEAEAAAARRDPR